MIMIGRVPLSLRANEHACWEVDGRKINGSGANAKPKSGVICIITNILLVQTAAILMHAFT